MEGGSAGRDRWLKDHHPSNPPCTCTQLTRKVNGENHAWAEKGLRRVSSRRGKLRPKEYRRFSPGHPAG